MVRVVALSVLLYGCFALVARNFDGTGPCGEGPGSGCGCGYGDCQQEQGRFCCKHCLFMGSLQQDSLAMLEAKEQMLVAMLKEVQAEKARRA